MGTYTIKHTCRGFGTPTDCHRLRSQGKSTTVIQVMDWTTHVKPWMMALCKVFFMATLTALASSLPIVEFVETAEEIVPKVVKVTKVFSEKHFMEKMGYFDDMAEKGGLDYNAPKEHNDTVIRWQRGHIICFKITCVYNLDAYYHTCIRDARMSHELVLTVSNSYTKPRRISAGTKRKYCKLFGTLVDVFLYSF